MVAPKTAHIATHVVAQEASVIPALQRHQSKLMILCSIQLEVGFLSISESFLQMENDGRGCGLRHLEWEAASQAFEPV